MNTSREDAKPIGRRALHLVLAAGLAAATFAVAQPVVSPAAAASIAWSQFGNGPSHSGVNAAESQIIPATVASLTPLFTASLRGVSDGPPVEQPGVSTAGGTRDLLFTTTKDGWITATDATTGAEVWAHQNGPGTCKINGGSTPCYTTSSPAVGPGGTYVYSYGLDGKVHKYATGSGTEVKTGGWPQVATVKPQDEKSSPALTIVTTGGHSYLYVSNGGYPGDRGDYQGHVTTIDLGSGTQRVFNSLCSDKTGHLGYGACANVQSAVWARPSVVYDPGTNRILFSTGNSKFDGTRNWGDSVLAINPDGSGTGGGPVDSYTPSNYAQLDQQDLDLGSTAPQVVTPPANSAFTHLAMQSGKDAMIRLLNTAALGGGGAGHTGGELQSIAVPQGGQVLTQPANWVDKSGTSWVFVANNSGISALKLVVDGARKPALQQVWKQTAAGTTPIVAGGVLFYLSKNGVRALNPATGAQLWTNTAGGSGLHWQSPIVVNGKLYFTDGGGKLRAFAIPPSAQKVARVAGDDRYGTSAAVSAATYSANAPVAYVASGLQFPDALAGSPAAGRAGGPMLLVQQGAVPLSVQAELRRLHPAKIVVLGGATSVSNAVMTTLKGFTAGGVTRVSGSDRFETAAAVSRATAPVGPAAAYVVSGLSFPDALSAGALAARTAGAPLLLTTQSSLPASTAAELKRLAPKSIVVVGGAQAVSAGVLTALKAYTTGSVSRISGSDRFETSAAAAAAYPAGTVKPYVASGLAFPDALSASAAAGTAKAPLLLTEPGAVPPSVAAQLNRLAASRITVVGGTDAVSDAVQAALASYVK
ncbi:cell wall-binding repeat-containing protein [Leifsonia sp. fls2-241-R2A-40a]|uniref:cell wall-binding repeat-containing protein n=1 Tax=Leifsonia sp. fls2-241-R2A-40a TaxID=3040290 RepID=UPI00254DDC56|nr:cell wall-binding repeat-containing protein [Leifsonia sp. fls2-241-R2A-40a]